MVTISPNSMHKSVKTPTSAQTIMSRKEQLVEPAVYVNIQPTLGPKQDTGDTSQVPDKGHLELEVEFAVDDKSTRQNNQKWGSDTIASGETSSTLHHQNGPFMRKTKVQMQT
ncbi:unnamed protein product [Thlaspi arvense]|uniref:Uncharacterized protein n=1 Tax=Thlaspi arvense TaxID=13288 RepID=A0AAU9SKB5_THLAR|nr:unnamed protein product [Thlaspi arvense]